MICFVSSGALGRKLILNSVGQLIDINCVQRDVVAVTFGVQTPERGMSVCQHLRFVTDAATAQTLVTSGAVVSSLV